PGGQTGVSRSTGQHRAPPSTTDTPTAATGRAPAPRPAPAAGSRPTTPGSAPRVARTGKDPGSVPSGTSSGTPPAAAPTPVAAPADVGTRPRSAVVRPGDCLWLIAARRLGPQA